VKKLAMGLSLFLLSGCFVYVPVDLGVLPVGGSVRVQVEERRDATFRASSGSAQLSGILVRENPTDVVLRVPLAVGSEFGQELTIPISSIVRIETREMDGKRSALLGVGVLGATAGIMAIIARPGGKLSAGSGPNTDTGEGFTGGFGRTVIFSIPAW
jgi:hypothetical protein